MNRRNVLLAAAACVSGIGAGVGSVHAAPVETVPEPESCGRYVCVDVPAGAAGRFGGVVVAGNAIALPDAVPADAGPPSPEHCIHDGGVDLNELHATPERIVADGCTDVLAGERWAPAAGWITNTTHEVIPPGYVPVRPTPSEDFAAKVVSVRYVVDAGTRQERSFTLAPDQVLQPGIVHPIGLPMVGIITVFHPVSVGPHTVDVFVTLSADHWDGFDVDPAANLAPAGETHWVHYAFDVHARSAS